MRVGWLVDRAREIGGAELTQAEFRAAAPDKVEIIDCPAGKVVPNLDLYVVHNCVQYTPEDLEPLQDRPAVKYWHDVGPHLTEPARKALSGARQVCCSPLQAEFMGLQAECVPPPVDLDRFTEVGRSVNGDRKGAVSVGSWRNIGKAPHRAVQWASQEGVGIDFYGGGPFAPPRSQEVAYDAMPFVLARYKTFVYLPAVLEPFGRVVVEAWAAGCEVITNDLVGARWWIEQAPDKLETAAQDFWRLVLE